MYANTTSIFVFGHGVGYTVEKAVEAATTHSDENGARKRKPFASGHKGAKETHMGMTIAQKTDAAERTALKEAAASAGNNLGSGITVT